MKNGDKFVKKIEEIPYREHRTHTNFFNRDCSIEDLIKRHRTHTEILAKQEECHKSKFDNWMKWHEETLAERDKSIEEQQVALENLSSLIKQKNEMLYSQRLKLASQMKIIDELSNKLIELVNKKEEPKLRDFIFAGELF